MAITLLSAPATRSINDRDIIRRVNALRKTDNVTNWLYILREYLFLGSVLGAGVVFFEYWAEWGLGWWWNVPVALVAILLVGAGQHRLSTLSHEASHYMLFKNRLLNEWASDLLAMFPMWSTTHHYRIQHLAHHQFPNDPERDPDISQMEASGHLFQYPMKPGQFVWECVLKQLLIFPKLIRYIRVRAKYNSTGEGTGPYEAKGPRSKLLILVGVIYLVSLAALVTAFVHYEQTLLLAVVPPAMLIAALIFFALVPQRHYRQTTIKSDVSPRAMTFGRMTFFTVVFTGLGWVSHLTGSPWGLYYAVLWLLPLITTFGFFMILRQIVQHGNASGDRFTNTRVFLVGLPIRFAVFPLGMDYHLPHHLFPLVPHYRIKQLHDLLMETEEYRNNATTVEGYFFHRRPPEHATVLELMSSPPRERV